MPATRENALGDHAIVIGGSLAGLLAARVLARWFRRVTVLERRTFDDPGGRGALPQANHLHALLTRGQQVLEELFPGIGEEMAADGLSRYDVGHDGAWLTPFGWSPRFHSGVTLTGASRDFLDRHVRRRIVADPAIRLRGGAEVTGLVLDGDRRVAAVGVRWRQGAGEAALAAELVVEAGGRNSKLPRWLEAGGFPAPAETVVDAQVGYASRFYRVPPALAPEWVGLQVQARPDEPQRGAALLRVEHGRWLCTLAGSGAHRPPTDEAGYLEFARTLRTPLLHQFLRASQPLSPIVGWRATENRWRHYETLAPFPGRLLVLGDSACAPNPLYAQGMTVAALSARALGALLAERRPLDELCRRFPGELARVNRWPWQLATSSDLAHLADGPAQRGWRHRYVDGVIRASVRSPWVRRRLLEVIHMLRPPTALFHPRLLAGVAWEALRGAVLPAPEAAPFPAGFAAAEAAAPVGRPGQKSGS